MVGELCPLSIISYIKQFHSPKRYHPSFKETIDNIFVPLSELLPTTIYIVDGLDECDLKEVQKVLKTFRELISPHSPKIFISRREGLDVTTAIPDSITICISNKDNRENIRRFIK